jgi:hypothetical protein
VEYSTKEAADALGVALRRLDNTIARHGKALGCDKGQHGRARRISAATVELLALTFLLCRDLSMPVAEAAELARRLVAGDGVLPIGALGELRYDLQRLRLVVRGTLANALEAGPRPRRGRPARDQAKPRDASA